MPPGSMSGKTCIVTGANSGIGKETVKALLISKAKVYIASHNRERCEAAIAELEGTTGHRAIFLDLDLAKLHSVKLAAEEFQRQESVLHVLVNNAGAMLPDHKAVTAEGYDLQFGINVIGHYYFTRLLIPQLAAAGTSRVVNVSSASHLFADSIHWETLKDGPSRQKVKGFDLYNQSKFGNVVFASEFARRYGDQGIVSSSVHPGLIVTNVGRNMPKLLVMIIRSFCYNASMGALTSLFAASAPEAGNANGAYFTTWARLGKANPKALDPKVGEMLWQWLEEETGSI